MNLGHQRASGVDRIQLTRPHQATNLRGDAMHEKTANSPAIGTSASSFTNTAPLSLNVSTTYLLCTIS